MNTTVIPMPAVPDHSGLLANGFDVPHGISVLIRDGGHLTLEGKVSVELRAHPGRTRSQAAARRSQRVQQHHGQAGARLTNH